MRQLIKQRIKNEKGLTLIELLAVIVILGIIAAIAIPSIGSIIQKSKEDAVKADAITVINAAKNYVAANGIANSGTTTVSKDDLADFVNNVKIPDYDVKTNGTIFELTSKAVTPAGKRNLSFTNATINEINDFKVTNTATTIGGTSEITSTP